MSQASASAGPQKPTLNFEAYQAPPAPHQASAGLQGFAAVGPSPPGYTGPPAAEPPKDASFNVQGPRKWGPSGYNAGSTSIGTGPPPVAETPAPAAAVSEKEKMAAALFSGLGGAPAKPKKPE